MGGTEEVGEQFHLREGEGRGAGSYAEGLRRGGGGVRIGGCGGGGGYEGMWRGGPRVIRASGRLISHYCA